jgi:hypothetical protein
MSLTDSRRLFNSPASADIVWIAQHRSSVDLSASACDTTCNRAFDRGLTNRRSRQAANRWLGGRPPRAFRKTRVSTVRRTSCRLLLSDRPLGARMNFEDTGAVPRMPTPEPKHAPHPHSRSLRQNINSVHVSCWNEGLSKAKDKQRHCHTAPLA